MDLWLFDAWRLRIEIGVAVVVVGKRRRCLEVWDAWGRPYIGGSRHAVVVDIEVFHRHGRRDYQLVVVLLLLWRKRHVLRLLGSPVSRWGRRLQMVDVRSFQRRRLQAIRLVLLAFEVGEDLLLEEVDYIRFLELSQSVPSVLARHEYYCHEQDQEESNGRAHDYAYVSSVGDYLHVLVRE